jgi:hypothetical protein
MQRPITYSRESMNQPDRHSKLSCSALCRHVANIAPIWLPKLFCARQASAAWWTAELLLPKSGMTERSRCVSIRGLNVPIHSADEKRRSDLPKRDRICNKAFLRHLQELCEVICSVNRNAFP